MKKLAIAAGLGLCASLCMAQGVPEVRNEKVALASDGSATLKGRIKGRQSVRYMVPASAGGQMTVELEASNASTYFNIGQAGKDEAFYRGAIEGNVFKGRLPAARDYVITVYQMRNAARRNAVSRYTLRIGQSR